MDLGYHTMKWSHISEQLQFQIVLPACHVFTFYFLKCLRNVGRPAILEETFLHCQYLGRGTNSAVTILKEKRRVEVNFTQGKKKKKWGSQKKKVSKSPAIPNWTIQLCTLVTASGSRLPSWQISPWPGSTGRGKTYAKMAETPLQKEKKKPTHLLFGQLFGKP